MNRFQTIETVTDLASLPVGSIVLAAFPAGAAEKCRAGEWWTAGSHVVYREAVIPLPATLLWLPEWGTSTSS